MKLLIIVGTRPNFIKITQFPKLAQSEPDMDLKIVHTGQHHSQNMSSIFFRQFGFEPDHYINLETSTPTSNIGEIIIGLEKYVNEFKPDMMMVVGDVNSTLAGAVVANKMGIRIAHLESGLRSGDRSMPEEINRILTDEITDTYFVTEQSGVENLLNEGKSRDNIHFVGNTMIDALVDSRQQIEENAILDEFGMDEGSYGLVTMHRPATVDNPDGLEKLINILQEASKTSSIIFPIHPRTLKNIQKFGMLDNFKGISNLRTCEPLDYYAFQNLIKNSKYVITDSGGIQEETTYYGTPCITLRPNTERPSTVDLGTNTLINFDLSQVIHCVKDVEEGNYKKGQIPPLWDGKATERIVKLLMI